MPEIKMIVAFRFDANQAINRFYDMQSYKARVKKPTKQLRIVSEPHFSHDLVPLAPSPQIESNLVHRLLGPLTLSTWITDWSESKRIFSPR
jgi:hypothetical protein